MAFGGAFATNAATTALRPTICLTKRREPSNIFQPPTSLSLELLFHELTYIQVRVARTQTVIDPSCKHPHTPVLPPPPPSPLSSTSAISQHPASRPRYLWLVTQQSPFISHQHKSSRGSFGLTELGYSSSQAPASSSSSQSGCWTRHMS